MPRPDVTDQIEISIPSVQTVIGSLWNSVFMLDPFTLALGRAEGQQYDQVPIFHICKLIRTLFVS